MEENKNENNVSEENENKAEEQVEKTPEVNTETIEDNSVSENAGLAQALDAATKVEKAPVEETPTKEKPAEEPKQADSVDGIYNGDEGKTPVANSYFQPVHPVDNSTSIDEQIDFLAEDAGKKFKKNSLFNGLCMGIILVVFAIVLLTTFLTRGKEGLAWVQWVVLGIGLAFIIVSFIISSIVSKKRGKIAQNYLQMYQDKINGYVASELDLKDPQLAIDAKLEHHEVIQAHYFRTINKIESRCVVEATRHNHEFRMGEISVIVPAIPVAEANKKPVDLVNLDGSIFIPVVTTDTITGTQEFSGKDVTMLDLDLSDEANGNKETEKRNRDVEKVNKTDSAREIASGLFGRLHSYDMKVASNEAFIIAYMGNKDYTYLPDFLSGYSAIHVPGLRNNIVVYAVDPRVSAKFFDEEGVRMINEVETNNIIQSAFISVNSYGSKVGMTLSDDIMRLPNKSISHVGSYDLYKNAIVAAFKFIDTVDEKRSK